MSLFLFWTAIGFVSGVIYASFFEWTLHRYVMHRPLGKFTYPYVSHALVHHRIFKSDHTYHLINEKDKYTIPMAWWNGPVLIAIGLLPFLLASLLSGQWGVICGAALACGAYYGAYEYMHWCMHSAAQTQRGTFGNFLPAQRPSPAAPSLHEPEL